MATPSTPRSRRIQPVAAPAAAAALLLFLAGCATTPPRPAVAITGDPVIDGNAQLAVAPAKDRVLWDYRIAAAALRRGQSDEAKAKLDDGIAATTGILSSTGTSEAAKSRRLFRSEADKPYVGEPYERVMASFYRGLLYWADGEPDNARALFRNGQLADSDTTDKTYAGDWVLLDYLEGLATTKLAGDGTDALARARASAKKQGRAANLPDYQAAANVLVFVEYGRGPRKYSGGEHGELLKFYTEPSRIAFARLTVGGRAHDLPPFDDVNYQATTRGGRVMDHILGNKAVFKENTGKVGDVALTAAAATAAYGRGEDSGKAALALAAVGLLSKVASAATQASADIRTWDNLPQYLSFAALELPPGDHAATLTFYDASGNLAPARTQNFTLTVPAADASIGTAGRPRDVVVFRSELPN